MENNFFKIAEMATGRAISGFVLLVDQMLPINIAHN
jgi:hypothetical protein